MVKTTLKGIMWGLGILAPVIAAAYLDRATLDGIFGAVTAWLGSSVALDRWLILVVALAVLGLIVFLVKLRPVAIEPQAVEDNPLDLSSAEATVLHDLFSLALETWYSPKNAMRHPQIGGEQEAQAVLEKLHRKQLVLRKRYTPVGHPQYRLSAAGRALMTEGLDQVPVPTSALSPRHKQILTLAHGFLGARMSPTLGSLIAAAPFPLAEAKIVVDELCQMRLLEATTTPQGLVYKLTARGTLLCKELIQAMAKQNS